MAKKKKTRRRQRIDTLIDAHVALRRAAPTLRAKSHRRQPAHRH
jgi:hypothetical protein